MDKADLSILLTVVFGVLAIFPSRYFGIISQSDLVILVFILATFVITNIIFTRSQAGQDRGIGVLNTKADAITKFSFSMNGLLAAKELVAAQDVHNLYSQYQEEIRPILTAPNNPLSPEEGKDYNALMNKMHHGSPMDEAEIQRLKKYLEREKADAEKKNDSTALFGIIIAIGVLALIAGLASKKQ